MSLLMPLAGLLWLQMRSKSHQLIGAIGQIAASDWEG
jgi:hypothetical protein